MNLMFQVLPFVFFMKLDQLLTNSRTSKYAHFFIISQILNLETSSKHLLAVKSTEFNIGHIVKQIQPLTKILSMILLQSIMYPGYKCKHPLKHIRQGRFHVSSLSTTDQ